MMRTPACNMVMDGRADPHGPDIYAMKLINSYKMKRGFIITTFLLLGGFTIAQSQNSINTHQDSLNHLLNEYYRLNVIIFQENSTIADIDNLFALFAGDFTYVHEKYGGVYTRQDLYDGYKRNQENGGYDGEVTDIRINNKIVGRNAIAVNKSFIKQMNGEEMIGEPQMALFEFKNGKIFRITEYW